MAGFATSARVTRTKRDWRLTPALASELCAEYHRRTRDDVSSRLTPYLLAYSSLKVARARCSALSAPPAEQVRLAAELDFHTTALRRLAARNGFEGRPVFSAPRPSQRGAGARS